MFICVSVCAYVYDIGGQRVMCVCDVYGCVCVVCVMFVGVIVCVCLRGGMVWCCVCVCVCISG